MAIGEAVMSCSGRQRASVDDRCCGRRVPSRFGGCSRAALAVPGGRAALLIVGEVGGAGGQAAGSARILASAVM